MSTRLVSIFADMGMDLIINGTCGGLNLPVGLEMSSLIGLGFHKRDLCLIEHLRITW